MKEVERTVLWLLARNPDHRMDPEWRVKYVKASDYDELEHDYDTIVATWCPMESYNAMMEQRNEFRDRMDERVIELAYVNRRNRELSEELAKWPEWYEEEVLENISAIQTIAKLREALEKLDQRGDPFDTYCQGIVKEALAVEAAFRRGE